MSENENNMNYEQKNLDEMTKEQYEQIQSVVKSLPLKEIQDIYHLYKESFRSLWETIKSVSTYFSGYFENVKPVIENLYFWVIPTHLTIPYLIGVKCANFRTSRYHSL